MRVLVLGCQGDLGSEIMYQGEDRGLTMEGTTHSYLDVTDSAGVWHRVVETPLQPDVVVNCTAYHRVDQAEKDPKAAAAVNTDAVRGIAAACKEAGALFVTVSTDYVFDGRQERPYVEADACHPVNVYGQTKWDGEREALFSGARHLVIRTSGLFGSRFGKSSKGGDFPKRLLGWAREGKRLEVVGDLRFAPTYVPFLAGRILDLAMAGSQGLWHVTNSGEVCWAGLAEEVLRAAGVQAEVEWIPAEHLEKHGAARRPRYSVLRSERAQAPAPFYSPLLHGYVRSLVEKEAT